MDSAKDSKTYEALAFQGGMESYKMILKISEDRTLVDIELHNNGRDKFYASGNFATCAMSMDEFLDELERHELIAPRPKTAEHQAQGLLEMMWGGVEDTEAGGCGSW
ncbi:MAG: hypothetical protein PHE67_12075 [Campylobacterales bacterium]|nr:hypothetical protein [Campylobacterales bacterium]